MIREDSEVGGREDRGGTGEDAREWRTAGAGWMSGWAKAGAGWVGEQQGLVARHDSVPDRPSAKVAPDGRQLAIMALTIKTVTVHDRCVARQKLSP